MQRSPNEVEVILYKLRVLRLMANQIQSDMMQGRRRAMRVRLVCAMIMNSDKGRARHAGQTGGKDTMGGLVAPANPAETTAANGANRKSAVPNLMDEACELNPCEATVVMPPNSCWSDSPQSGELEVV